MKNLCFYFQVHQPYRLRRYRFFDIGNDPYYYDDFQNRSILRKVAQRCYLPANQLMLDLIREYGANFKVTYSLSGVVLEQFETYAPEVIESFKRLAETGCVEFLAETYSHSLVSLMGEEEFKAQVEMHGRKIESLFGVRPTVFRNTELVYSDQIGRQIWDMGYKAMLAEGARQTLGWKSPNYLYCNAINPKLKVLLRNYTLTDDIAFRFSNRDWNQWPLTADKFVSWLTETDPAEEIINLFMDYETFGEHQWAETGIFDFLKALPAKVLETGQFRFVTPSEAAETLNPVSAIHVQHPTSWADAERDLTAWLGNEMQKEAHSKLYALQTKVKTCKDPEIQRDWLRLQTSDHFYYICTKWFADGTVHKYFNPWLSPYDAFINFMNVLSDFAIRVNQASDVKTIDAFTEVEREEMLQLYLNSKKPKGVRKKPVS